MNEKNKKVAILMATYNGSRFISEQIESLMEQTFKNWILYVRDDLSTDETLSIVESYAENDKRIKIVRDGKGRLGACQNFARLCQFIDRDAFDYFMFCDQDDRWRSEKIEISVSTLENLEVNYKNDFLLAYGTLLYTDSKGVLLKISSPDFSSTPTLGKIIAQNYIYGCTMIMNKKLFNEIGVIPEASENHDYWIALVAMFNDAKTQYISQPLVFYRQHDSNVSGSYMNSSLLNRIKRLKNKSMEQSIFRRKAMIQEIFVRYQEVEKNFNILLLTRYLNFLQFGGIANFYYVFDYGVRNFKFHSNILYYYALIVVYLKRKFNFY
ncbi:glycosyltransferase [Comamonas sp. Y33R10-2]|uniref:glycosyltransferase n=1 Tax=Comamonas sp. Y33R10-2 TaxID=2853257 RepID=UPI001C5CB00A|nr:glycosyltransferase [Comamonas sp. Y33R10-2]QXZ09311.1 glycosyltransferase [Comamonas sp. Y33R10-2]